MLKHEVNQRKQPYLAVVSKTNYTNIQCVKIFFRCKTSPMFNFWDESGDQEIGGFQQCFIFVMLKSPM